MVCITINNCQLYPINTLPVLIQYSAGVKLLAHTYNTTQHKSLLTERHVTVAFSGHAHLLFELK